jgi:hypothetical protein
MPGWREALWHGNRRHRQLGPSQVPGIGADILVHFESSRPALNLEEVSLDTPLPPTAHGRPGAVDGFDLEPLSAPAKYPGKVPVSALDHLDCFIVDLPTHQYASIRCLLGEVLVSAWARQPTLSGGE